MKLLLLLTALLAACSSPSSTPPPQCRPRGQACDVTTLCCGDDVCTSFQCVAKSSPPPASDMARPHDLATPPSCRTVGGFCANMFDCCQGVTCPRYGTRCQLGNIGDPCQTSGDCLTGLACNGLWCEAACAASVDCVGHNYCVQNVGGAQTCFPICANNTECAIYPGTICQSATAVEGVNVTICSK